MKKHISAFLAASCLALSSMPVFAAGGSSADDMPAKTAGFLVGTVVGTPVMAVRRFFHNEVEGARGIAGNSNNLLFLVPAGILFLPVAAVGGALEGPWYSMNNSFHASQPFSKEQFSLGETQE